ncbi:competence type IV pilus minor pilin ComGF [Lactococcus termiticola]|uniref:Competence protein ComGF n=1 Tax=Lactococcus termiticola TaxID=2169526 RepID=A0A2R5HEJ1_9LACT|nr:competence type IV pilus minor pilin ComGF [Lactococcus termiticola]GBG96497.1 competence protein ComGF [Lactococcus termiticola]
MWKKKIKAFSLLETLVTLMVLSGAILVITGLTKLFSQEISRAQTNTEQDWQLFVAQMREELATGRIAEVKADAFILDKQGQKLRFGKGFSGNDFRKSNQNHRGYEPLLQHVRSVDVQKSQQQLSIRIHFEKGGSKTFLYHAPE